MRYWLDTEFIDDGSTIDLISIGIVSEDGRELYLQSVEFNPKKADGWMKESVFPHLTLCPSHYQTPFLTSKSHYDDLIIDWAYHNATGGQCRTGGIDPLCLWRTRKQIMYEVADFLQPDGEHTPFELIGWCAGYDFVVLCQLFGTMMDLPQGYPHYIRDLQHVLDDRDIPDDWLPDQENGLHNALEDAKHIKRLWEDVTRR
jgi:hypothetical protein